MRGKLDELLTFLSCPVFEFLKSLWWFSEAGVAHSSKFVTLNLDGHSIQYKLICNSNNNRSVKTTFNFYSGIHRVSGQLSQMPPCMRINLPVLFLSCTFVFSGESPLAG